MNFDWGVLNLVVENSLLEIIVELLVEFLVLLALNEFIGAVKKLIVNCLKEVGLATANITNNADEFTFLYVEIEILEIHH